MRIGEGAVLGPTLHERTHAAFDDVGWRRDAALAGTVDAGRANAGRVGVAQGDATALSFADETFDRAFSLLVLHHVSDAQRAVAEMLRRKDVTCSARAAGS